ncbi:FAD-dependent oxidoreductase [Methylobrevis pamukkalensis]|uniref:FAD-dependent oxidoreductase n=1 Tax=Methylobrevis pamukkalensis TaxID=1439726 RepID=UPI00114C8F40|nr:FAD-dependent oxidoreductase [Methylobrevis pamukkalensis]
MLDQEPAEADAASAVRFDEHYDVVVVGSGSAGASAALKAATGGLKVLILEKTDKLGGTSAMSGAGAGFRPITMPPPPALPTAPPRRSNTCARPRRKAGARPRTSAGRPLPRPRRACWPSSKAPHR